MARTTRTILSYDADTDTVAPAVVRDGLRPAWGRTRQFHGGMVMSPRPSGVWDDERPDDAHARRIQRRAVKRRERRLAMADALSF